MEQRKVKVKYLTHRGEVRHKTLKLEVPEHIKHKTITHILETKLRTPVEVTVDKQFIEYLDATHFGKKLMDEDGNIWQIIDYWIVETKSKRSETDIVKEFLNKHFPDDQVKTDFIVMWGEMAKSLKGLSTQKKIGVVMDSLTAAYKSSTESYRRMGAILKGEESAAGKIIGNGKIKSIL